MFWIGISAAGLIALLAVGYVVWPLFQPGPTLPLVDDDRMTDLLIRKDTLLRAIKDLDFDFQMGKMSEADYERFAARLRRQALGIIQQIDKIAPESALYDQELEAEIARLRKVLPATVIETVPAAATGGEDKDSQENVTKVAPKVVAHTATAPELAPDGTSRFCTQCGKPIGSGHKFCAECGTPVHEVAR